MKKTAAVEIYNEAIENLSSMKDNFCLSKDMSKSYQNKKLANSELINNILNKNKDNSDNEESEYLNESFGNHKTTRRTVHSGKLNSNDKNETQDTFNSNSKDLNENISIKNQKNTQNIPDLLENKNIIVTNTILSNSDIRLEYALKILDLENLLHLFNSNKLTFNDMLFLSKEDLIEMSINLAPRNRILKFSEIYKTFGKEFTLEEVLEFFAKNKHFVFNNKIEFNTQYNYKNSHGNYTIIPKCEEEKVNNYENNVLSTANFEMSINKNKNSKLEDEVFLPKANTNTSNCTLANYISSNDVTIVNQLKLQRSIERITCPNRSESEEKACQTDKNSKKGILCNNNLNILTIKSSEKKSEDTDQSRENNISNKINNVFVSNLENNNLNEQVFNIKNEKDNLLTENISDLKNLTGKPLINDVNDKKNSSKSPSLARNNKSVKNLSSMVFRKNNVIQKQYENMSNEVEKYIKNYKELKEKSYDRQNRLKCIISRSSKQISKSRSKSKDPNPYESINLNNYNLSDLREKSNYNSNNDRFNHTNKPNKYSKLVNSDDLKVEEERNLDEEMNKILFRINTVSQQSLDSHSIQHLNRIKSLANLKSGENKGKNLKLVDIDYINKVKH